MTVVSRDVTSTKYKAKNLLTLADIEIHDSQSVDGQGNYWLAPYNKTGHFHLDLGCVQTFDKIKLVNTHNGDRRNWSTKRFRYKF